MRDCHQASLQLTGGTQHSLPPCTKAAVFLLHKQPQLLNNSTEEQLILNCRMEYFSRFVPTPSPSLPSFAGALLARMAARIFVFTVRHAALLRPLSQPGKLQLAKVGLCLCLFAQDGACMNDSIRKISCKLEISYANVRLWCNHQLVFQHVARHSCSLMFLRCNQGVHGVYLWLCMR